MDYQPTPAEIERLQIARKQAWDSVRATALLVKPGMNEEEARKLVLADFKARGFGKSWHAPKIRFGVETLKNFAAPADQDVRLKDSDIFFLDYGPVIDGFEADVGDTFVVGNDPEHLHLQKQCREIFDVVADHWRKTKVNGLELYEFAAKVSADRDVKFEPEKAGGHMIAEFPHQLKHRGGMSKYQEQIIDGVWVLEIQLSSLKAPVGAFYEDLLISSPA